MISVTLLCFSGRPNYSWFITDPLVIRDLVQTFLVSARGSWGNWPPGEKLGFNGLAVRLDANDRKAAPWVPEWICVGDGRASDSAASQAFALALLTWFTEDPPLREAITHTIRHMFPPPSPWNGSAQRWTSPPVTAPSRRLRATDGQSIGLRDVSVADTRADLVAMATGEVDIGVFNKAFWNNDPERLSRNNCYAYACNYTCAYFPEPGNAGGVKPSPFTMDNVIRGMLADGLKRVDSYDGADRAWPNFIIAMVITEDDSPRWDYHYYRMVQRKLGGERYSWGHKPGATRVRRRDEEGMIIYNPELCARGRYTRFGGYFITSGHLRIS